MTFDSMRVALRGVLANRMRSALTMLGILIGTAAVILLVGVGQGISDKVQDQIKSLGTNAIYVIPERNSRGQDRGGTSARRVRLTERDVEALSDPVRGSALAAVTPAYSTSGTLTWQGTTYSLSSFLGAEPVFAQIRNANVSKGRWLDEEDVRSRAKVAVVGVTLVDKLFGKGFDPVGQQVEFN
ncbi:MAG TPA: ABC transporter permease, partial [Acidimicrobiia bacterium]|nr:ABC transporter permease [Acidimicrobiia bacterium]